MLLIITLLQEAYPRDKVCFVTISMYLLCELFFSLALIWRREHCIRTNKLEYHSIIAPKLDSITLLPHSSSLTLTNLVLCICLQRSAWECVFSQWQLFTAKVYSSCCECKLPSCGQITSGIGERSTSRSQGRCIWRSACFFRTIGPSATSPQLCSANLCRIRTTQCRRYQLCSRKNTGTYRARRWPALCGLSVQSKGGWVCAWIQVSLFTSPWWFTSSSNKHWAQSFSFTAQDTLGSGTAASSLLWGWTVHTLFLLICSCHCCLRTPFSLCAVSTGAAVSSVPDQLWTVKISCVLCADKRFSMWLSISMTERWKASSFDLGTCEPGIAWSGINEPFLTWF